MNEMNINPNSSLGSISQFYNSKFNLNTSANGFNKAHQSASRLIHKDYPKEKRAYKLMDANTYELRLKHCMIRKDIAVFKEKHVHVEKKWTIEDSIFKDYLREEKASLAAKSFEFDWKNLKPIRYKRTTEEQIKNVIRDVYPIIREQFREWSGLNPSGNILSISLMALD